MSVCITDFNYSLLVEGHLSTHLCGYLNILKRVHHRTNRYRNYYFLLF